MFPDVPEINCHFSILLPLSIKVSFSDWLLVETQFNIVSGHVTFKSPHDEIVMCLSDFVCNLGFVEKVPSWRECI